MEKLVAGQTLWYVPSGRGGVAKSLTVTKVGRKWASVGKGWEEVKIHVTELYADGGQYTSPGHCYLSQAAYDGEVRLQKEWEQVRDFISRSYRTPDGMTFEKIAALREMFGIPTPDRARRKNEKTDIAIGTGRLHRPHTGKIRSVGQ